MPWPAAAALAIAAVCAAGGIALLVYGIRARPYGPVEAEMVFEASRIRAHEPLYVDPIVGAWEAGAPPSRYYVLYTPVWPWLLARLPTFGEPTLRAMRESGRLLVGLLWVLTLAALWRGATRTNRLSAAVGALLVLGFPMLVREAGLATADVPAVAISTWGLLRVARRGRLDPLSAALLAAAPLVKPSLIGGPVGAYAAHAVANRHAGAKLLFAPLVVGAAVAGALGAGFSAMSHGQWLLHLVRATGQTLSLDRWVQEFGSRAVFLGVPHAAVLAFAWRRRAPLTLTLPLATSLAWAAFAMCKHGSGTHYWLEPTTASLVTLGRMPPASPTEGRTWLSWAGLGLALGAGAESLPALARAPAEYRVRRTRIEAVRAHCALAAGQVVMADDVALELELDGRIVVPAWQNSYLLRAGKFPLDAWKADLARREVAWFVHDPVFFVPAPMRIEGATEVSAYRRELRSAIEENFVLDGDIAGVLVFRRR